METSLSSNFQFGAIFNEAAIGIIVTDSQSRIILSNRFADNLFGYDAQELIGQNISVLIPNHLKDRHAHHQANYIKSPQARPMGVGLDLKAKRKNETLFPVEISLSHFKENDQLFHIAFVSDVTLKRKVEMELILKNQEINQLNESLEEEVEARTQALQNTLDQLEANTKELEISLQKEKELGDLKTRFVSMASHEFRTPLTSILSSASLIEKYQLTEEQAKRDVHIQRIKASVSHLTEILEEFLSVGKLESGTIELHPSPINLNEFLTDFLLDLKPYEKANQKIQSKIQVGVLWNTDLSILRKILINGLSNALKFSEKNVFIDVFSSEKCLIIKIKDQGMGISQEDQKHLFERFFRGSNATVIPGTGLGLHLIDRYIKLLGGSLEIISELNKGTELIIQLPEL
ncbi:MAG: ATP-binding protein [Aquirufa sp.]